MLTTSPSQIDWDRNALKDFKAFPSQVREKAGSDLSIAAYGSMSERTKPMKGFGSGVLEIGVSFQGNAYRVVYVLEPGSRLVVLHAFMKKSRKGSKTPMRDIDLIRKRLLAHRR